MDNVYHVYALRSEKDGRVYVGFSHNVEKRLLQHNAGKTRSTKGYRPWVLIFYEEVRGRAEARNREKYYKTGIGKEFLKSLDIKDGPVIQRIEYLPAAGRDVS